MAVSRIYCVGGYCFNLFLPASLLEKMENLSPFRCMEDAVSPESFLFELHEGELWPDPDELRILYCSAQGPYAPVVDIYQSVSAFCFSFSSATRATHCCLAVLGLFLSSWRTLPHGG